MTLEAKLGSPAAAAFIRAMTKAAYSRFCRAGFAEEAARAKALEEGADWLAELLAGTFESVNDERRRPSHVAVPAAFRRPEPRHRQEAMW